MDLTPYLSRVADDLDRLTSLSDDQTRAMAARVATALEPALRLAIMQALADAAATITSELCATTVLVRLEGRDPVISVQQTEIDDVSHAPSVPAPELDADDGDTARVTVRLPAALKGQAEARAAAGEQSLNTWLVQTIRRALAPTPPRGSTRGGSRRVTGWA